MQLGLTLCKHDAAQIGIWCCSTSHFAACICSSWRLSVWYKHLTFALCVAGMKKKFYWGRHWKRGLSRWLRINLNKQKAHITFVVLHQNMWLNRVLPRCHSDSSMQTLTFSMSLCNTPSKKGIHEISVFCLKKSMKWFALMPTLSLN